MKHFLIAFSLLFSVISSRSQTQDETKDWLIKKFNSPGYLLNTQGEYPFKYNTHEYYVSQDDITKINVSCKINNQFLEISFWEEFSFTPIGKPYWATKSSFYKIDLSKVDTTFSYDYGKYFFKTSGNYIEKKIDYNAYYKSKKFHNQNEYTWQEYRWDAVSGEDIGFYDKCIIKINESAEPDIVARIQKALKHYIKLMPVVKSSNEAF